MNRNFLLLVLACLLIASHASAASKDVKVGDDVSVSVTTPKSIPGSGGNVPTTLPNKKTKAADLAGKNKQLSEAANAKNKLENAKNAPANAKNKLENAKNAPASAKNKLENTKNAPAQAKNKIENTKGAYKLDNLKATANNKTVGTVKNTSNTKVPTDKGQVKGKIVDAGVQQLKERTGK